MWKSIYTKNNESNSVGIEVTKNFFRGRPAYSIRIGAPKADGSVGGFLNPEVVGPTCVSDMYSLALEAIEEDKKEDAVDEARRVAQLAEGTRKNPNANTGLSRFKNKNNLK